MKSISTILFGIALSVSAWASDFEAAGTWHDPDHGGHGIILTADSGFGHVESLGVAQDIDEGNDYMPLPVA